MNEMMPTVRSDSQENFKVLNPDTNDERFTAPRVCASNEFVKSSFGVSCKREISHSSNRQKRVR